MTFRDHYMMAASSKSLTGEYTHFLNIDRQVVGEYFCQVAFPLSKYYNRIFLRIVFLQYLMPRIRT